MKRYRKYTPGDDFPEVFGDARFVRLDMNADPATLPPGVLQVSENMRFDTFGTTSRAGIPRQFPPGTNIGTIFYTGIYKPDTGVDLLAFVTKSALWLFNPDTKALTSYNYPAGEVVAVGDVTNTIQAGIGVGSTLPMLFLQRGLGKAVLRFSGTGVVVDSTVPKSEFGVAYQNRIALNSNSQSLSTSDFLDFTIWNLLNQFQIERGGADYLVSLLVYQKDYVLIGARKKIFIAYFDPNISTNGYAGGLTNASFVRLLTSEAGPVGREAMLESAGLVWFVTDNGIYAFQPQLDNELTVLGRPLSVDINPVFSRLSAAFAGKACIQRYGYRLYFALPIADEPLKVTAVSVSSSLSRGVDLPFDLPVQLAAGGIATISTDGPHNLKVGDYVLLANLASATGINGQHPVASIIDGDTFTIAVDTVAAVTVGERATFQKLATRNNTIAVFNLNNRDADHPLGAWESIDSLPSGFFADWLRIADFGAQRRLWVIDAVSGPALYEEGGVDEIGDVVGGVNLPVDLPFDFSAANYASVLVPGRWVTRSLRWEDGPSSFAYPRRVRAMETRLTLNPGDAGTVTVRVRTPDKTVAEETVTFTADATGTEQDHAVFKRLFVRGLEAEVEMVATGGRPTVRAVEVQALKSGDY